jgi:hypothetical protein
MITHGRKVDVLPKARPVSLFKGDAATMMVTKDCFRV